MGSHYHFLSVTVHHYRKEAFQGDTLLSYDLVSSDCEVEPDTFHSWLKLYYQYGVQRLYCYCLGIRHPHVPWIHLPVR